MAVAFHSDSIEIQEEDDDDDGDNQTPEDDVQYENVETKTSSQKHPQKKSVMGRCKLVGLGLGLLCGVQALLNIGLRMSLYSEPINNLTNLTKHLDHLQSRYDTLTKHLAIITAERDDLKRKRCEPCGWQTFGSSCYYISTERKTWVESRKYCTDRASDLIVINSQEEQDFVNRTVNRNQDVWLGLTDREEEGVWKWVDDKPLISPTPWNTGEPNDGGKVEDCAVFSKGGWDDRPCDKSYCWICERGY